MILLNRGRSLVPCVALLVLSGLTRAQNTLNVPSANFPTIQAAITSAQHDDTVLVATGTYFESIDFLGKRIVLRSAVGPQGTTILGTGSLPVVRFATGEVSSSVLEGFTIRGGHTGILCEDTSPLIRQCAILGNSATNSAGGGIRCIASSNASPTIRDCEIKGNFTNRAGGGVYIEVMGAGTSSVSIVNTNILNNFSSSSVPSGERGGGGIRVHNLGGVCSLTLTHCDFFGNVTPGAGGGLSASHANFVAVNSCRFVANSSGFGGGLYAFADQITILNSLIAGNHSSGDAGGIATRTSSPATVSILGCTVAGNHAVFAGGIEFRGSGTGTTTNSIIWNNDPFDLFHESAMVLNVTYSNVGTGYFPYSVTNLSTDPLFLDASNHDYHLSSTSACVDSGTNLALGIPPLDLDGTPRVQNGTIDLGADEYPAQPLPGTGEDIDLYTYVNQAGDPTAPTMTAVASDTLTVRFHSPSRSFVGHAGVLLGELYATGFPPIGIPGLHFGAGPFVMFSNPPGGPFGSPGIPPEGITLDYHVPGGLAGSSIRLQAFVLTSSAANGLFASSSAHDIVFS